MALPFDLVRRQVAAESSFNPRAQSPVGAQGLLQLMPGTARELGCSESFNPDENLKAGTTYLAKIVAEIRLRADGLSDADTYRMALCGYNAGPGYVYAALKLLKDAGGPLDWPHFKTTLPRASVRGRTPLHRQAIAYAEKIMPLV